MRWYGMQEIPSWIFLTNSNTNEFQRLIQSIKKASSINDVAQKFDQFYRIFEVSCMKEFIKSNPGANGQK